MKNKVHLLEKTIESSEDKIHLQDTMIAYGITVDESPPPKLTFTEEDHKAEQITQKDELFDFLDTLSPMKK